MELRGVGGTRENKREFSEVGQVRMLALTLGLCVFQSEHVNVRKHKPTGEPTIPPPVSEIQEGRCTIKRGLLHKEKRIAVG